MASFAHIGSWSDEKSPPGEMYPAKIEMSSSTGSESLWYPTNARLGVQRTPRNNTSMEYLLRPTLYDEKTSAPWHTAAEAKTVHTAEDTRVLSTEPGRAP